jgi:hypothetical protein
MGGINLFVYGENNTTNNVDRKGLHGIILGGRGPYIFRPRFLRGPRYVPKPRPKTTPEPKIRPAPRGAKGQPPEGWEHHPDPMFPHQTKPGAYEPPSGPFDAGIFAPTVIPSSKLESEPDCEDNNNENPLDFYDWLLNPHESIMDPNKYI